MLTEKLHTYTLKHIFLIKRKNKFYNIQQKWNLLYNAECHRIGQILVE